MPLRLPLPVRAPDRHSQGCSRRCAVITVALPCADPDLGAGAYLGGIYTAWGQRLALHWPDEGNNRCLGCGEPWACTTERTGRIELARIERMWREASMRLNDRLNAAIAAEAGVS